MISTHPIDNDSPKKNGDESKSKGRAIEKLYIGYFNCRKVRKVSGTIEMIWNLIVP